MPNKRKVEVKLKETSLLKDYGDPSVSGSLGGVQRFARAHKLPLGHWSVIWVTPYTNPGDDIFLPSP